MSARDRNGLLARIIGSPLLIVALVAAGAFVLADGYTPGNDVWGPRFKPGAAALGAALVVAAGLLYRRWERRL